jgi:Spy/CpxP family protein refolding chaperone
VPVQNKALRIGAITAAVIGTVAIPATAFAATSSGHNVLASTAAIHAQQHQSDGEDFASPADRGDKGADHLAALATALNTTPDALKAAMKAAMEETKPATRPTTDAEREAHRAAFEAALAAKLNVTVDALKAALEANKPEHGPGGPGGPGKGHRDGGPGIAKLATALNTTPDALEAAMKAAREETKPATRPTTDAELQAQHDKYLAALAGKLNVSVDTLKAALEANKPAPPAKPTAVEMKAMIQPRLAQMVTKGTITQAQADQILADIDAGKPVFEVLKQFMPKLGGEQGKGRGGERGERGEHGRGPGAQSAPGQQRGQQGPRA